MPMWSAMEIVEYVHILHKVDKGIIPRRLLISGILTEVHCEERHRRGLVAKGAEERAEDRKYRGFWRDWE
jgi:hypothetical protein